MYLLDANVFLELLLDQERADDVERFMRNHAEDALYISDFSLYAIGIILFRHGAHEVFNEFLDDVLVHGPVDRVTLSVDDLTGMASVAERFNLDFDDAYQYVLAERHDLEIVSFDRDFDRTERGRTSPQLR